MESEGPPWQAELSGQIPADLQVAEFVRKTIELQVPATATELREFCMGNGSKALALCAARPHIVAVR
jgi:hypothetical protein